MVTVLEKPSGLPMAIATWPTRRRAGIAEFDERQRGRRSDAQDREVRVGIVANEVGLEAAVIRQSHDDVPGTKSSMKIRSNRLSNNGHTLGVVFGA